MLLVSCGKVSGSTHNREVEYTHAFLQGYNFYSWSFPHQNIFFLSPFTQRVSTYSLAVAFPKWRITQKAKRIVGDLV